MSLCWGHGEVGVRVRVARRVHVVWCVCSGEGGEGLWLRGTNGKMLSYSCCNFSSSSFLSGFVAGQLRLRVLMARHAKGCLVPEGRVTRV